MADPKTALSSSGPAKGSQSRSTDKEEINTQLLEAVGNEDLGEVIKLLGKGADVNTKGYLKEDTYKYKLYTPLILAAEKGFEDLVKVLLEVPDTDLNQGDQHGFTALHEASRNDRLEVVEELLARPGIDVNIGDPKYNYTPLNLAARRGHTDVVKALLKVPSILVNKKDITEYTALREAACKGEVEVVKALLEVPGIQVNEQDKLHSHTALHLATDFHHTETVRALLNHPDVDVNIKDKYGQTPLHTSAYHGNIEVVKMLLEAGINAKEKTLTGNPAVHYAAKQGHVRVVEMILDYIQNPTSFRVRKYKRDKEVADLSQRMECVGASKKPHATKVGRVNDLNNQLLVASKKGELEKVEDLLKQPSIDVNFKDRYENTPLHLAAEKGHLEVVKALLEKTVDVNVKNKDKSKLAYPVHIGDDPNRAKLDIGKTPLLLAVEGGHGDVVKLFLNRENIDVNVKDKYDTCPLVIAVGRGYTEIVKLLLSHPSIDVKVKDTCYDHFSLLHLTKDLIIAKTLLHHPDIEVNQKDKFYESTPLHYAVNSDNLDMVKVLLDHPRVDVNEKGKYDDTPLHVAAEKGNTEIVKALLDHPSISINKKGMFHELTPLHVAAKHGNLAMIEAMLNHPTINVKVKDKHGQNPFDLALKNKHWLSVNALQNAS